RSFRPELVLLALILAARSGCTLDAPLHYSTPSVPSRRFSLRRRQRRTMLSKVLVLYFLYGVSVYSQILPCHQKPECPIDLFFLIDTSETIALQEDPPGSLVESVKEFTITFAQKLENVDYKDRVKISWSVGGLHFSMRQKLISALDSKNKFIEKLRSIQYLGKGTFIDCAITNMTTEMLRTPSKPNVKRFAVVITDGHVTGNPCGGIKVAAERARDESIKLFAVATSMNLDEIGLREIANSPAGVYRSDYMAVSLTGARPLILTETIDRIYDTMLHLAYQECYSLRCLETPGPPGPAGYRGQKGAKGDHGVSGHKGERGRPGDPGIEGPIGHPGRKGERGLKGEKGDIGTQGKKGVEGLAGRNGTDGQKGKIGRIGASGCKGDPGDKGPDGYAGDVGDPGQPGAPGDKVLHWEIQVVPGDQDPQAQLENLAPKVREEVREHLAFQGRRGLLEWQEALDLKGTLVEEETLGQRGARDKMEQKEKRANQVRKAYGDLQEKMETKVLRGIKDFQDQEAHQVFEGSPGEIKVWEHREAVGWLGFVLEELVISQPISGEIKEDVFFVVRVAVAIPEKQAPEVTRAPLAQVEILADRDSAIQDREDQRVTGERKADLDPGEAEGTVDRRENRERRAQQENLENLDPKVSLDQEGPEETREETVIQDLKEIQDSLSVFSLDYVNSPQECDVMSYIRETCGCCDCEKRCGALDIVFVIDSSESVGLTNFTLEKNFVINTINRLGSMAKDPNSETGRLNAVPGSMLMLMLTREWCRVVSMRSCLAGTRVGVVQYSHSGTFQAIHLNDSKIDSLSAFKDAVKKLEWIAGGTWTPSALKFAYDNLIRDSRRSRAKVTVVVITDGRFDPRDDDKLLTYLCTDNSVDVNAIGIGDMFEQPEENESLKSIACQKQGRVTGMRRFADLVAEEFIDKIETVLCPDPVIVCPDLPCKSDVTPQWNGYPLHGPFAEEGTENPVPSTVLSISKLLNSLQEAKHPETYTRAVATMAYTAQRAKFAIGPEKQQWTDLFIDSFRVVYGDLLGDPNKALGLYPAVANCIQRPVDLVFLLDGSERMGLENFRQVREFVEKVAHRLTLARGDGDERNTRVALLQYGDEDRQEVAFRLTHNLTVIADGLSNMRYLDSASNLGSAIIYAINNILMRGATRLARRNAEISFVFITDGVTGNKNLEEGISSMRRAEGVATVIAMGSDVDQEVLTKLALGDQSAIFRGQDFSQLSKPSFFERFIQWIC
ncbi:hypothetical protein P4O66_012807, partial [Electrophorus voltai]